jgi:DNA-binding NarL/FixJ family response regulator
MSSRVLIVDDNAGMRRFIRVVAQNMGFEVCGEAENGFAGVQRAQELLPDLVLLDLSMPVMNGAIAASVLKSKMPDVRVVLFTMHDFGESLAAAVGVDVVLCKTDGVSELTSYLQSFRLPKTTRPEKKDAKSPSQQDCSVKVQSMEPFDIFRVLDNDELAWLGSSATIEEATAQVEVFGATHPGSYIIFDQKTESKTILVAKASEGPS